MKTAACVSLVWLGTSVAPVLAADPHRTFDPKTAAQLPADFKATGGEWTIENGKLKGEAGSGESTLVLGADSWRDVAVEVQIAFAAAKDPTRWFAIGVREGGDAAPGVQLTVRQDTGRNNGLEIASRAIAPEEGWRVVRLGKARSDFVKGGSHRVRLEAVGNWICGYLDGKMVIRSYRGDEFSPSGQVLLRVNGATVMIDSIQIAPATAKDTALAPVRTRPLVVAHRGFSYIAPENTLASYRLAIEAGADMAECDVYLTKDNVPVLMHDGTLARTAGHQGRLRDMTLAEAKKLDAGKWKSPKFEGERIPTLVEAIKLTAGKLRFVIEIKEENIAADVVKAIKETGIAPQDLMIFSFHARAVDEIAKIEPLLPTTWLVGDPGPDEAAWRGVIADALRMRTSAIGTSLGAVDPGFVRLAHECGLDVFVWTVNDPRDVAYLVRIGVDGIISDRPDMALEVVKGAATKAR